MLWNVGCVVISSRHSDKHTHHCSVCKSARIAWVCIINMQMHRYHNRQCCVCRNEVLRLLCCMHCKKPHHNWPVHKESTACVRACHSSSVGMWWWLLLVLCTRKIMWLSEHTSNCYRNELIMDQIRYSRQSLSTGQIWRLQRANVTNKMQLAI